MATRFEPRNQDEVREVVAWALAEKASLRIEGRGSKRGTGPHDDDGHVLSLKSVSGVIGYQPDELVLTARAGTRLAEIEALLAQRQQMLAFEPIDLGALRGAPPDNGSLGGTIACNLSGPRRISAGAARDHFLGFQAINGRAEIFKSGGKVMKNVTGYDLSKLLAGSAGTLAVLDEITVKVLPAPERAATLMICGLADPDAVALLCAAMGGPFDVSGAAHLPADVTPASRVDAVRTGGSATTVLRIEGVAPSVEARLAALKERFVRHGRQVVLDTLETRTLWREIRDARPLWQPASDGAEQAGRQLWRLSVPPASGAAVVAALRASAPTLRVQYDWSGGLIWLSVPPGVLGAQGLHPALAGGHAKLIAPGSHDWSNDGAAGALAALSQRVRRSFDPQGVFAGAEI